MGLTLTLCCEVYRIPNCCSDNEILLHEKNYLHGPFQVRGGNNLFVDNTVRSQPVILHIYIYFLRGGAGGLNLDYLFTDTAKLITLNLPVHFVFVPCTDFVFCELYFVVGSGSMCTNNCLELGCRGWIMSVCRVRWCHRVDGGCGSYVGIHPVPCMYILYVDM